MGAARIQFSGTVLLVEPNSTSAVVAKGFLDELGLSATHVTTAAEALAGALGGDPLEAILLQARIDGIGAEAVISEVRRAEFGTSLKRVPIVAMTADEHGAGPGLYAAGADVVLPIPFDQNDLAESLIQAKHGRRYATVDHPLLAFAKQLEAASIEELDGDGYDGIVRH